MHAAKRIRELTLILGAVALAAVSANAQPLQTTFRTIEARVAQADHVAVGTIDKVSRKVSVEPGGKDKNGDIHPDGQFEYTVTLKVGEFLKGDLKGIVDDLCTIETRYIDNRYEEWSQAQTTMLWFLGPAPKAGARRQWEILPLGKPVPAERLFDSNTTRGGRWRYSKDFTLLKNDDEVLACARAYGKTSQKVQLNHSIQIPSVFSPESTGGGNYLIVPVEPTLEERARRLIASPQDFAPKGKILDSRDRDLLRLGGVTSLRYFKSDANAALLQKVLESEGVSQHLIRTKAIEVLLHWGVEARLPESAQEITALDLTDTDVSDKGLKQLAKLKNLTTLDLQNTKVTTQGLSELAGLKKLTALGLSAGQLTDANLRVLREIGLLHRLPQTGTGPNERPKSAADVGAFSLWHSPVTDEGLRELAGFKNLAWLDLRDTRLTDAGLKELAGLKNLSTLFLQGTQVTDAGVAELQKALPKCDIRRRTMIGR